MKERKDVPDVDVAFELPALLGVQAAFLAFPGQVVHTLLVPVAECELKGRAGCRAGKSVVLRLWGCCGSHEASSEFLYAQVYHEQSLRRKSRSARSLTELGHPLSLEL